MALEFGRNGNVRLHSRALPWPVDLRRIQAAHRLLY